MTFYFDTNVIVSVIVSDAHSQIARTWLSRTNIKPVVSDFAALEFAAVVSRQFRVGRISESEGAAVLTLLDDWSSRMAVRIKVQSIDLSHAGGIVRDFSLKLTAPDALHLAVASNRGYELATFDVRLAEAARSYGVHLITPH